MNMNYKKLNDLERQMILTVLDGSKDKSLLMLVYMIHQSDFSFDVLSYLIQKRIYGQTLKLMLAEDYKFDFDRMIASITTASKSKFNISDKKA